MPPTASVVATVGLVSADGWTSTTHDWQTLVDEPHLKAVSQQPDVFAAGGVLHLLHEVLAYVADDVEALEGRTTRCDVTVLVDGSLQVRDYGRGTDTRRDTDARVIRKPVMATRDLRFFDSPSAPRLPDGVLRKGMSVVAALSHWLVDENYRLDGAWRQRYEQGIPSGDLEELEPDGSTGTSVRFLPQRSLAPIRAGELLGLSADWPALRLTCRTY